jgi:TonB family protein
MDRLKSAAVLAVLLATAGGAQAQDSKQRFVGKSPCAPDIQSELSDFGLRLDKTQNLTLLYRDLSKVKIVAIIQPDGSSDGCGLIRDVVQITHITKDFEFRCFDPQAPADVIIGTAIRKYGNIKPVTTIEAWRIDLKEQKFIETRHKVTCTAKGWAGEDDGGDLVDEAKKYAADHKAVQSASKQATLTNDTQRTPLTRVTIEGELIEGLEPKYPEEALKNRFTGTVALHVILEKDGAVRQVEVVSGHPMFAQAAIDALRQWKYQPTVLNGEPVEVDTIAYVMFTLGDARKTNP